MNTKGIKFLAVLAVLAMAFAAFAVIADTESDSAAGTPDGSASNPYLWDTPNSVSTDGTNFNKSFNDILNKDTKGAVTIYLKAGYYNVTVKGTDAGAGERTGSATGSGLVLLTNTTIIGVIDGSDIETVIYADFANNAGANRVAGGYTANELISTKASAITLQNLILMPMVYLDDKYADSLLKDVKDKGTEWFTPNVTMTFFGDNDAGTDESVTLTNIDVIKADTSVMKRPTVNTSGVETDYSKTKFYAVDDGGNVQTYTDFNGAVTINNFMSCGGLSFSKLKAETNISLTDVIIDVPAGIDGGDARGIKTSANASYTKVENVVINILGQNLLNTIGDLNRNIPGSIVNILGDVVIDKAVTVNDDVTFTIESEGSLTVDDGSELVNNGIITVKGGLYTVGDGYVENVDDEIPNVSISVGEGGMVDILLHSTNTHEGTTDVATLTFVAGLGGVEITVGSVVITGALDASEIEAQIVAAAGQDIVLEDLTVTSGVLNIDEKVTVSGTLTINKEASISSSADIAMENGAAIYNSGRIDVDGEFTKADPADEFTVYATESAITNVDNKKYEDVETIITVNVHITGNGAVAVNGAAPVVSEDVIGVDKEVSFLKDASTLTLILSGAFKGDYSAVEITTSGITGLGAPYITLGGTSVKYDLDDSIEWGDDATIIIAFVDTNVVTIKDGGALTDDVILTATGGQDNPVDGIWIVKANSTITLTGATPATHAYSFKIGTETIADGGSYTIGSEDVDVVATIGDLATLTITAKDALDANLGSNSFIIVNGEELEINKTTGVELSIVKGSTITVEFTHYTGYSFTSYSLNGGAATEAEEDHEYELEMTDGDAQTLVLTYTINVKADWTVALNAASEIDAEAIGDADVVTVTYIDDNDDEITANFALGAGVIEDVVEIKTVTVLDIEGYDHYTGTYDTDGTTITVNYAEDPKLTITTAEEGVSFTVNGVPYTAPVYVDDDVTVKIIKTGFTVTAFNYTLTGGPVEKDVLGDSIKFTTEQIDADKTLTINSVTGNIGSYNISIIPIDKATITTSQALATQGTQIIVYVVVNDSKYTIGDDSVIVVDSELEPIPVTPVKDEDEKILYYTFVMPGDNVTVTGELLQTSYSVSVSSSITNGKVTASPTSIKASDLAGGATKTVTLTIEPKTGYELGTLKVKNAEGEYIEYVLDKNKATFVVSEENASDFTVTATFQEVAKAIYTGLQQYIVKFDGEAVPIDIVVFNDQMKPVSGWSISSSDSTVVKVVQDPATKEYTVTAEKAGTAKLTVKYGSLTTTAVVKVYTAIGELKSGISVDQTLNGAWMIADGIESFKVEKGATLTIAKDASLDLNGKVLRVDGKLVISQGANVYGGTIDFAVDASIDNKGFVGMDEPVSIIIHSYTEDGIYVAQTGNITVCDVNGVEMSAEEDDDVDGIYYMVISGDIEGFTVFSNVTGTFISDDLSLSAVELWNSSIKVSEDTTLNIGDDAYANDVYMMLEEGAKAVVDGKTKDVVVMAYTGTQLVSAVDPVYTPTALFLDNVKGVEVVSYKEKYAVYNEWTEENVYWYKMVMDVSGEVSMVDVSKKAATFKVMAFNDDTLVGATVTDNLVLPKDIQFAKLSDYTPSAGSRAEVIIPLLEDSMLYVEGLVKLAGDEAFVALTNVEGTEYISEKVVYVSNFEDAVDAISTVTDKKIFVYGDVTLESDLAADCVIEMLDGVLTIGDDATVKVAAKADIVPKAGTQIEVEGIIILLDGNNSLILPTELHGYNVKTENPDGSIEYSSLAAAIASGKKDITIEGVAFLDEKTSVDSGSKITVPKDADLIILNNFNLAEGATITVEKGGDLFIGTLEKLVEFNVNGTITIEKGAKILLHDAKVTVSGTIIVENGAEIVADDSVEVNAAAVIVPVEKKDTTFITNIDNAVTIANTYAKDPVEIEVYGKINGGNVKLADNISITFMDDVKSKVSIELSKTSTVTINAGAEVSGTIAAPYGAEDGLKTLKATVSGASNVKFVVTSEESDKVYYTAEIKVISPANKVQGEITVTEGEAKITTNMKVANTTEEPSKLTINANATVYLAKNVELDAGKGTTVKGALVVEKDAVLKAKDLSASGTVYVEKDGTIEITKMTVTGSLVIEEDAAKAVIKGALTVGSKSKSLGDAASVIGDITLEEGTIKVYAGGDVSGAYINWDDINEKSDSVNTVFTINDKIYMTVYANKDAVLIGKILADESFEITGVDNAALKVAANWSGSKNAVAYDAAAGTGTKIGATDYTTVGTKAIPSEVTLKVSEGTGLKVFIDGFGYLTYDGKIAVGTHTVKFDVESGYDGSKATIAVNGKTVKSGESFTVTADDLQIVIVASGATPVEPTPSPEPQPQPIIIEEDDSFGLTQILLIALVIMIGVLVVVLILRFNRS